MAENNEEELGNIGTTEKLAENWAKFEEIESQRFLDMMVDQNYNGLVEDLTMVSQIVPVLRANKYLKQFINSARGYWNVAVAINNSNKPKTIGDPSSKSTGVVKDIKAKNASNLRKIDSKDKRGIDWDRSREIPAYLRKDEFGMVPSELKTVFTPQQFASLSREMLSNLKRFTTLDKVRSNIRNGIPFKPNLYQTKGRWDVYHAGGGMTKSPKLKLNKGKVGLKRRRWQEKIDKEFSDRYPLKDFDKEAAFKVPKESKPGVMRWIKENFWGTRYNLNKEMQVTTMNNPAMSNPAQLISGSADFLGDDNQIWSKSMDDNINTAIREATRTNIYAGTNTDNKTNYGDIPAFLGSSDGETEETGSHSWETTEETNPREFDTEETGSHSWEVTEETNPRVFNKVKNMDEFDMWNLDQNKTKAQDELKKARDRNLEDNY